MSSPPVTLGAILVLTLAAPSAAAADRLAGRARVIDGDTIVVNGVRVRLKGIAAPEVARNGKPGGEEAKAFLVDLIEGEVVVCDLTGERTWGCPVAWCYRDGGDIAEAEIRAGLARDCSRHSKGRYAAAEQPAAKALPFPSYCRPR